MPLLQGFHGVFYRVELNLQIMVCFQNMQDAGVVVNWNWIHRALIHHYHLQYLYHLVGRRVVVNLIWNPDIWERVGGACWWLAWTKPDLRRDSRCRSKSRHGFLCLTVVIGTEASKAISGCYRSLLARKDWPEPIVHLVFGFDRERASRWSE
jgi:hypothetical protein